MYLSSITGFLFFLNDLFIFWPRHETCKIVVFQLGIKPLPPAVVAWSLNHWTAREVPLLFCFFFSYFFLNYESIITLKIKKNKIYWLFWVFVAAWAFLSLQQVGVPL